MLWRCHNINCTRYSALILLRNTNPREKYNQEKGNYYVRHHRRANTRVEYSMSAAMLPLAVQYVK